MGFIQAEALPAFIPDHLLKDVCITNTLGRQTVSLPEQRAGMLTAHYKRFGFLKLEFPLLKDNACACKSHLDLFMLPCGNWV